MNSHKAILYAAAVMAITVLATLAAVAIISSSRQDARDAHNTACNTAPGWVLDCP